VTGPVSGAPPDKDATVVLRIRTKAKTARTD
jgi:hypothetical protein